MMNLRIVLVVVVVLGFSAGAFALSIQPTVLSEQEIYDVLVDFWKGIKNPPDRWWNAREKWGVMTNICAWKGIYCKTYRPTDGFSISLEDGVNISIPPSFSKLGSLLTGLSLRFSDVAFPANFVFPTGMTSLSLPISRGANLPESLGDLPNLQSLSLRDSSYTSLPQSIGRLTTLTSLDLSNTQIKIDDAVLSTLTSLRSIYMSGMKLGTMPAFIQKQRGLQELDLSKCQISGGFPVELPLNMRELKLNNNAFSGPLPANVFNYSTDVLDLSFNSFSGSIPKILSFARLYFWPNDKTCPKRVDLSNNQLTGNMPPLAQCPTRNAGAWDFTPIGLSLDVSKNKLTGFDEGDSAQPVIMSCNAYWNPIKCPLPRWAVSNHCIDTCSN